jgi:uncharacterized membrane protein YraQ (UPF0718 family)
MPADWFTLFSDKLATLTTVFLGIFIEAAPCWVLGTLASGVVDAFVKPEQLGASFHATRLGR